GLVAAAEVDGAPAGGGGEAPCGPGAIRQLHADLLVEGQVPVGGHARGALGGVTGGTGDGCGGVGDGGNRGSGGGIGHEGSFSLRWLAQGGTSAGAGSRGSGPDAAETQEHRYTHAAHRNPTPGPG